MSTTFILILGLNKKSIQVKSDDLPLCNLILLWSNNPAQAQDFNHEDKTKGAYQR